MNFSYESLAKSKKFKVMMMFGVCLGGAGLSVYSKYFNSEIDVVYNDSELMDAIVPRIPALFKVKGANLALLRDELPTVSVYGDHLLSNRRAQTLRALKRGAHPDTPWGHPRAG